MLSGEGPSGPLCSSQVPAAAGGDGESPGGSEAGDASGVAQDQILQFSIRDYVSTVRKKDIRTNWPFHQQFLQLCLHHGISVVLPPFEAPGSVRSYCGSSSGTGEQDNPTPNQAVYSLDSKFPEDADQVVSDPSVPEVGFDRDKQTLGKGKEKIASEGSCENADGSKCGQTNNASVLTNHFAAEQSNPIHSLRSDNERVLQASVEVGTSSSPCTGKVASAKEPSGKKYRLIVKLGANPELGRTDEISSNSSIISDPMASKVCPVCKSFTSSSNTTLNAHIDQCLSVGSSNMMEQVDGTPSRFKLKPTKRRLMVDIYNTAPRCTLEDLDRRNGTSWALDLAAVPSVREFTTENKRHKSSVVQGDGENENGAVYVDSNGTKLCILSKLSGMASTSSLAESSNPKPKRFEKDIKQLRQRLGKRRHIAVKGRRHMKAKALRRKVGFSGLLKDRTQEEPSINPNHDSPDSGSEPQLEITSQDQIMNKVPFRSSKVSKNLSRLLSYNSSEKPSSIHASLAVTGHSHPQKSSSVKCSSPKLKSMKMLSNSLTAWVSSDNTQPKHMHDHDSTHLASEVPSERSLLLKPPKPLRKLLSVRKRRMPGKDARLNEMAGEFSGTRTDAGHTIHPQAEEMAECSKFDKSNVTQAPPSSVVNTQHRSRNKLMVKRLQGHRSRKRACKEVQRSSPGSNECFYPNSNVAMSVDEVNDAEVIRLTKNDCAVNHQFEESSQAKSAFAVRCSTEKYCKFGTLGGSNSGGEFRDPETVDMEIQAKHSVDPASVDKPMSDGGANPPLLSGYLPSEGLLAASDSSLKSWARLVENNSFIPGNEVWADANDPRLFDHKAVHSREETGNGIAGLADVLECEEAAFKAVGNGFPRNQYIECPTNAQHVLGSSTCQSSSANTSAEVPRGSSSVTSARISPRDGRCRTIDSGPCDSPVSGTSNVSHPSGEELKEQNLEPEVVEAHIPGDDSERLVAHDFWESGSLMKNGYGGECYQGVRKISLGQQHGNYSDNQCCCCSSRTRGGRQDTHLWRQYMVPEMHLPPKLRQLASNFLPSGDTAFSAFTRPASATVVTADSVLQSPCHNVLQSVHSDAAEKCCRPGHAASPAQVEQLPSPNPVLRLMGKDVLVLNKDEENTRPRNTTADSSGLASSSGQYSSFPARSVDHSALLSIGSNSCHSGQFTDEWKYAQNPRPTYSEVPLYSNPGTGNMLHSRPNRPGPDERFACNIEKPRHRQCPKPPYSLYEAKEVIVIDDSEAEAEPDIGQPSPASTVSSTVEAQSFRQARRPSCFPLQYPFQTTSGFTAEHRPSFPNIQHMVIAYPPRAPPDHRLPSPLPAPPRPAGHPPNPSSMPSSYFRS